MTTILQASIPGPTSFERPSVHSSSSPYSSLASINTSMHYGSHPESKSSYLHAAYEATTASSTASSTPSSPTYTQESLLDSDSSTPASSLPFDCSEERQLDEETSDGEERQEVPQEEESLYAAYDRAFSAGGTTEAAAPSSTEDDTQSARIHGSFNDDSRVLPERTFDDQAVEPEPTRHVDYLSHEWREEDIWSSWRYIVCRRKKIANSIRLENAAWRTWVKAKYNLRTVSPETLNWLKDCDVTWLYGPLQVETSKSLTYCGTSQPTSHLSTSSSFSCKKPILKKKSASAVILERSRSQQSLLQRAGDIIRQQQSSPAMGKTSLRRSGANFVLPSLTGSSTANTPAEYSQSSLSSQRASFTFPEAPTPVDQKHVLFNEEVRQVQAIESDDDEEEDDTGYSHHPMVWDSDEDGGELQMKSTKGSSNRTTPRNSFSNEGKTIIPLPPTTLKYRTDTPEPPSGSSESHLLPSFWPASGRRLSPSPSQETLRPSRPSHNFLIDDDPEVTDEPWHTSADAEYSPYDDENEPGPHMRRTPSGMFMPYDGNEDDTASNKSLLGQAAYAVNTFKDIAHVVWNVGWNRR